MARIFVADDEEPMREIIAAILHHEGYECLTVPSGVDALRLIEAGGKFDLVTSDICNGSMSGSGFLNQIK